MPQKIIEDWLERVKIYKLENLAVQYGLVKAP